MDVNRIIGRIKQGARVYLWVMREHLLSRKLALVTINALGAGGALAHGSMIAFIVFAVNYVQNPRTLGVAWLDRLLANSVLTLTLFGLGLLVLMTLGALATYLAMVKARALARSFHSQSAVRGIQILCRATSMDHALLPPSEAEFRRLIVRNCLLLGKAIEAITSLAAPLWRTAVLAIALFALDLRLSLVVTPLFLLLLPLVYKLTAGVQEDARSFYDRAVIAMSRKIGAFIRLINNQNVLTRPDRIGWLGRAYDDDPEVHDYFDAYDRIQLAQDRVQLATSLVSSVFLVSALVVGGYLATVRSLDWGIVTGYLFALLQLIAALRQVLGAVTNLSLYYPAVGQYRDFYLASHPPPHPASPTSAHRDIEHVSVRAGASSPVRNMTLEIRRGRPVCVISKLPLNRLDLDALLRPLCRRGSAPRQFWSEQTCFVGARSMPRFGSLAFNLALDHDDPDSPADVLHILRELDLDAEINALENGVEAVLDEQRWPQLSPHLRLALMILPVLFDERSVAALDMRLLRIDPATARNLLDRMRNKFVLIVTDTVPPNDELADLGILVRDDDVHAVGPLDTLRDTVAEPAPGPRAVAVPELDDVDLLE